jgi:hypothetical protein
MTPSSMTGHAQVPVTTAVDGGIAALLRYADAGTRHR